LDWVGSVHSDERFDVAMILSEIDLDFAIMCQHMRGEPCCLYLSPEPQDSSAAMFAIIS
jgi:hypothetical protein